MGGVRARVKMVGMTPRILFLVGGEHPLVGGEHSEWPTAITWLRETLGGGNQSLAISKLRGCHV